LRVKREVSRSAIAGGLLFYGSVFRMSGVPPDPSGAAPIPPRSNGLRANYLIFPEVIGQSVGTIAPSVTPALLIGAVFASAGNGTWLAYAFATVALVFASCSINQFASRIASSGSFYVFVGKGLGLSLGVIAGWSLIIAYLFTAAAVIGGAVNYLMAIVHDAGGVGGGRDLAVGFSIIVVAVAWALAYRDIRLSTRTALWINVTTVALILLVVLGSSVVIGPVFDAAQLQLVDVSADDLRAGLVLAFFSFVGFESATTLGREARQPLIVIPRAVTLGVLVVGVFFVFCAYVLVGAFHGRTPALDETEAPVTLLARMLHLRGVGMAISAGIAFSFIACALGSLNAGARVLYALSCHGLFHPAAGRAHEINATPYVAVTLLAAVALGLSLSLTIVGVGLIDGFGYLAMIATFGFLVAYILVAVAAPVYLRRLGALRPHHIAAAAITVALLALPLIGSLYPVPEWPNSILPYVFVALVAAGLGPFWLMRMRAPHDLVRIRADFLAEVPAPAESR
jgi:amino acid transporter